MPDIKVLVVDDSAFMRKVVGDMVHSEPGLTLVGTARNGQDAIDKVVQLEPDVVTMDVEMPVMDGLTAVEKLMAVHPVPIIMLSNLTRKGVDITFQALQKGAVDFVAKPSGTISLDIHIVKDELVGKIKIAHGAKIRPKMTQGVALPINPTPASTPKPKSKPPMAAPAAAGEKGQVDHLPPPFVSGSGGKLKKLVVIGTSTGGPKALYEVIPRLPKNLGAAVLIVQHMPPGFTKSLAERLDQASALRVKEAENGEELVNDTVYIAPGDYHLCLQGGETAGKTLHIRLTQEPAVGGHRPAVDVMMKSAAQHYWAPMVGVILTGMGGDGSEGIQQIKKLRGGKIIAEDASTCVVFGMPKVAIETGVVDKVAPITSVADEILRSLAEV